MIEWIETGEEMWSLDFGLLQIKVHKHIDRPKDMWVCSCHNLNERFVDLSNKDLEKAKMEALYWVNGVLASYSILHNKLNKELNELRDLQLSATRGDKK